MSTPYFYVIEDTFTGELYAGIKYAKDADPSTFMKEGGYQTSSGKVKERISEDGLERFVTRKIKLMHDGDYAQKYEHRFLWKVKAPSNPRFLNGNYGNTPNQKGKTWWTDGVTNKLTYVCPEGFWSGKTQKSGLEHGLSGKNKSAEHRAKISDANKKDGCGFDKGYTPWNKGETYSHNTSPKKQGKKCWTNGITSLWSFEKPEGFWEGRTVNISSDTREKYKNTYKNRTWKKINGKRVWFDKTTGEPI